MIGHPGVRIGALLIDLDGVLRIWEAGHTAAVEQAAGLPEGAIAQVAFAPELLLPVIRGEIPDEEWRRQVADTLRSIHPEVDGFQAVAAWSKPAGTIDREVLAIIRACRRRVPVVLVTNATSRLPRDLARLGISHELDHIISSATIGSPKPEPGIFAAALSAAGAKTTQAIFVDDTAANVQAATQLGLSGHLYHDAPSLRSVLADLGLLSGSEATSIAADTVSSVTVGSGTVSSDGDE